MMVKIMVCNVILLYCLLAMAVARIHSSERVLDTNARVIEQLLDAHENTTKTVDEILAYIN